MASTGPSSSPSPAGKPVGKPAGSPVGNAAGKPAGSPAGKPAGASVTPVVKMPAAGAEREGNRKPLVLGGVAAGLVALVVVALIWKPWKTEPPRMNEEPYKIAKFVLTPDFKELPFERQYMYMELLDDKEKAVEQAYAEKKLSDEEFAGAQQAGYLGKHLKRARNYAKQSSTRAKEAYLDDKINKKKKKPDGAGGTASNASDEADEIKRDDSAEQETINSWPAEAQAQWTAYRSALKARKDLLKEQEEQKKAAATQSSRAPTPPTASSK